MRKRSWQTALRRALRIAKDEGIVIGGFEVDPTTGKIRVVSTSGAEASGAGVAFDSWFAKNARAS